MILNKVSKHNLKFELKESEWGFILALIFCLVWVYGGQFGQDAFLYYDDRQVISAMEDIHSLRDYIAAFKVFKICDLQPIRDLVTWFDYSILNWFHVSVFHLTNVFIWFVSMLGVKKLLTLNSANSRKWTWALVLLLAVNPIYVTSVSWLSARKHLLAACFVVWATYHFLAWLKEESGGLKPRRLFYCHFLYLLAVFSQPIIVFWPLFVYLVLLLTREMKRWKAFLPALFIMISVTMLNYYYYSSELYLHISLGVEKFSDFYNSIPSIRLFALGRYLFQVFVPYWTSISIYNLKNWQCLVGIFFYPLSIYFFLKRLGRTRVLAAYGFFFLMLAPVVVKMSQIFGSDTYLLTASFGIYFLLSEALRPRLKNRHALSVGLFLVIFIPFLLLSHERAAVWENDAELFALASQVEGGLDAEERYVSELMRLGRIREAVWHAQDILVTYPRSVAAQGVVAYAISNDPSLTTEQKVEKIYGLHFFTPAAMDFLARLEFDLKNYKSSEQLLLGIIKLANWRTIILESKELFAARVYVSCDLAKDTECEKKAALVQTRAAPDWDYKKYESEKKKLEGH